MSKDYKSTDVFGLSFFRSYFPFRFVVSVWVFLFIVQVWSCYAQGSFKEDSLLSVYKSSDDSHVKVNTLIQLANLHETNHIKKNLSYANQALDDALNADDYVLQAKAYNNLGISFMNLGSYDKATEFFLESKKLIEKHNDITRLAGVVFNLGAVRFMLNDMDGALRDYNEALDLNNKLLARGDSFYVQQIQSFYINIGSVYERKGNYKAAIEYMDRAVEASMSNNDLVQLAKANNNLGDIYIQIKKYDLARQKIQSSITNRIAINDRHGLALSFFNLTELYITLNKADSAQFINEEAVRISNELMALDLQTTAYQQKALVAELKGNYEAANVALKKYYNAKDSLLNKSVIENTTRLQTEYEYAKLAEERIRNHKTFRIKVFSAIGSLVLFLIIFILLFLLGRSKTLRLDIEKKSLEKSLEIKNKELTTNVMYLLKKNELIGSVSERLLQLKSKLKVENKGKIQSIILDLQSGADADVWEEFELRFQQVHLDFYNQLRQAAPDLTPSEMKVCAFLKLGMNSKEIATLIHQSTKSIEVKRSKIRKKLNLTNTDTNLNTFLNQLGE